MKRNERGITLIALIITVIVLLILAGTAVSIAINGGNIFNRTAEAREAWNTAVNNENSTINNYLALLYRGDEPEEPTLPSSEGTYPYFPNSNFSQVTETNLSNGLVITDEIDENGNSIGNEYVWVEVPRTAETYGNSFNLNYDFETMTDGEKNSAYSAIATALIAYRSKDSDGNDLITAGNAGNSGFNSTCGYTDTWYSGCGIADSSQYQEMYNKMLRSIYENGGFWVGRYEAGQIGNTGRADKNVSIADTIPLSKPNLIPIYFVTCSQAQTIATRVENKGTYNSSLLFGIQWDLMIKFLNNKGIDKDILTNNQTIVGNFSNSTNVTLFRGRYAQYMNSSYQDALDTWYPFDTDLNNIVKNGVLNNIGMPQTVFLTTGASNQFCLENIYDLSGNMSEYTLEKPSSTGSVCRGGPAPANAVPASARQSVSATDVQSSYSFRVTIY